MGTVEGLAVLHSATNQPLLAIPLHATLVNYQIRDNESAAFSRSGIWSEIDPYAGWYRDNVVYAVPGEPAVAEWRFDELGTGAYTVSATWRPYSSGRASNAPYEIWIDDRLAFAVTADQRVTPADGLAQGYHWQQLGDAFWISGRQSLRVRLTNESDGFVVADAVRLEKLPPADLSVMVDDGGQRRALDGPLNFAEAGKVSTVIGTPVTRQLVLSNASDWPLEITSDLALPSGYAIAEWSGPLRIDPGNELSLKLQLTAETLGEFTGSATIRSVTGEILQEFSVYGRVDPWVAIADDSGDGFTTQGTWASYVSLPGWFESSTSTVPAGDGQSYAEWRFEDLSAGTYQVAATWKPYLLGRAKNAPYEFWLDDQRVFQVRVNQRPRPTTTIRTGPTGRFLPTVCRYPNTRLCGFGCRTTPTVSSLLMRCGWSEGAVSRPTTCSRWWNWKVTRPIVASASRRSERQPSPARRSGARFWCETFHKKRCNCQGNRSYRQVSPLQLSSRRSLCSQPPRYRSPSN